MFKRLAGIIALLCVCGSATAEYGFEPAETIFPALEIQAIASGDISGDGRDDLIMLPEATGLPDHAEVLVAVQQESGQLATPFAIEFGTQDVLFGEIALVDIDADGDLDIFLPLTWWSGSVVLRNEGNLAFVAMEEVIGGVGLGSFAFDDVNEDGYLDVVGSPSAEEPQPFHVYFGEGDGDFQSGIPLGIPSAGELHLGDMNGDGQRDIVLLRGSEVSIYRQQGDGFSSSANVVRTAFGINTHGMALSDFDSDGRLDFVVTKATVSYNDPSIAFYRQHADGHFRINKIMESYDVPATPRFHDIDGDGDDDLIVPHAGWGEIGVYLKAGRAFAIESLFTSYAASTDQEMTIGDLDGDGKQDIATSIHIGGIQLLRGRDTPLEPDLGTYVALNRGAAAIRLQNHSAHTATGNIYLVADLDLRFGSLDVGSLPDGCERQPWEQGGIRLTCHLEPLPAGMPRTLTVPLILPERTGTNYLSANATASAGVRDMRPGNNAASKRIAIWPEPAKRTREQRRTVSSR